MKPLDLAIQLFTALNKNQIVYCHWKSNEHLLEGLAGETDLDVLADANQRALIEQIFGDLQFVQMKSQYGSVYPGVEDWLGCDKASGKLLHFHWHYSMITGHTGLKEYSLPWTELCLHSRRMHDEWPVYTSDPNLEIITLATRIGLKLKVKNKIRAIVGRYHLSDDDVREFDYLKDNADWPNVAELLEKYYQDDSAEMQRLIRCAEHSGAWILRLHHITKRHGAKWTRIKYPFNQVCRAYYSLALPLRIAFKKYLGVNVITRKTFGVNNGLMIAFVGQDGAGKSTITKELLGWMTWKADAKQYYLGSGDHYRSVYKSLVQMLSGSNRFAARFVRILASIRDLKHLSKRALNIIRKAKEFSGMGGIALFDRYPQIQHDGLNDGPKIRKITENKQVPAAVKKYVEMAAEYEEKNLKQASAIEPDLVFKLMLSPEESLRRKPEESYSVVAEKNRIIASLAYERAHVYEIDAAQDYEKELVEIHNIIWNEIVQKGSVNHDTL